MRLLSKKKIKKIMGKEEIITVGEFIKRYTGDTMSPDCMNIYYKIYILNNEYLMIYNDTYPIKVGRKK